MLTAKQRELLLFIKGRLGDTGVSPSFDEMREALELKSKSGVHRLISALEERGFIRRLPNRARALEVVKLPESSAPAPMAPRPVVPEASVASWGPAPRLWAGRRGRPRTGPRTRQRAARRPKPTR